jgi:hypothetical protein
LDGKVSVDGTLDKLQIGSEGLKIVDGLLGIEFTQVPYHVSGPVALDTEGLHFQNVSLSDGSDGKGTVTGSLLFGGFKNMRLDTHVQFDRMKVLGITDHNQPIYGDVYGTGRVDITGPFEAIASTSTQGPSSTAISISRSVPVPPRPPAICWYSRRLSWSTRKTCTNP